MLWRLEMLVQGVETPEAISAEGTVVGLGVGVPGVCCGFQGRVGPVPQTLSEDAIWVFSPDGFVDLSAIQRRLWTSALFQVMEHAGCRHERIAAEWASGVCTPVCSAVSMLWWSRVSKGQSSGSFRTNHLDVVQGLKVPVAWITVEMVLNFMVSERILVIKDFRASVEIAVELLVVRRVPPVADGIHVLFDGSLATEVAVASIALEVGDLVILGGHMLVARPPRRPGPPTSTTGELHGKVDVEFKKLKACGVVLL